MDFKEDITRNSLTRQEQLSVWLKRNGLTASKVARAIGMSPHYCWRILNAERAPVHRVEQLREAGIPEELLPRAEDVLPGNKPGWKRNGGASGTVAVEA